MVTVRTGPRAAGKGRAPAPSHLDALDGLRAAAAAAVLLTHVGAMTGYTLADNGPGSWAVSRGDIGVPVFFVLSGLLLYRPWAAAALTGRPARGVTAYLRRRALRILPAYWAVVLIALPLLNPGPARHVWPWFQYLLLLQNYDPHPWWGGTGATGLAQMWSLVVEVSFYLVLPVLGAALTWFACRAGGRGDDGLSRRARRLLAGIAVLAAGSFGWTALEYYPHPELWSGMTLPPLLIWFGVGMALATVSVWAAAEPGPDGPVRRFCRSVAASPGMCALIAGCAFAIACTPVAGPQFTNFISGLWPTEIKCALYTIVAAAVVAPAAFAPQRAGRAPASRPVRVLGSRVPRFLGKISYGIFLWQFLAAYAFFAVFHLKTGFTGGSYNAAEVAAIGLAIAALTVAAATASYYLIEQPAQQFGTLAGTARSQPAGTAGGQPAGGQPAGTGKDQAAGTVRGQEE
jgi:peptidoglycan/LPS O-acetylase OafA/YrhL